MRNTGLRWLWHTARLSGPRLPDRTVRDRAAVPVLAGVILVLGAVATACAAGLSDRASAAVGLGTGTAGLLAALAMLRPARRRRDVAEVATALATIALFAWTVVATAWTLPAAAARWIAFGGGLGALVLALALLVRRALSRERLVLVVEVRELRPR